MHIENGMCNFLVSDLVCTPSDLRSDNKNKYVDFNFSSHIHMRLMVLL